MVGVFRVLSLLGLSLISCFAQFIKVPSPEFGNERRVAVRGYDGEVMEPFLSRDGRLLFFNNSNDAHVDTNLHWAERIDDLTFRHRGELQGVNTPALEGVPSMDAQGNFFFVSNRGYAQTASTLYRARFADGALREVALAPGISLAKPGVVNFDAEISADGNTLYFVESQFSWRGRPKSARILLARRQGNGFVRDPLSEVILKSIDTESLNYAPATSSSELEIFFTRVSSEGPSIYTARRSSKEQPFDVPVRIAAISGFAEGPTISPSAKLLYYHKKENSHFFLYCVSRP